MTLLQAIKDAASIASKATYAGKVSVYEIDSKYHVYEFTDKSNFIESDSSHEAREIFSFETDPNEPDTANGLIKYARKELNI